MLGMCAVVTDVLHSRVMCICDGGVYLLWLVGYVPSAKGSWHITCRMRHFVTVSFCAASSNANVRAISISPNKPMLTQIIRPLEGRPEG